MTGFSDTSRPIMLQPKVSVIIVNWNGLKWLPNLLSSIEKQSYTNHEVIFVDNDSKDKSVQFIKKNYPKVLVVKSSRNLGFGGAANLGALRANGQFLLFLNEDMKLDKNLITNLVKCFQEQKVTVGIVSATEKGYYPEDRHIYLGYSVDLFLYTTPVTHSKNKIFYAPGAPGFIKKEVFDKVNGFDSSLFLYYEDVDLSWRVRLEGLEIVCCPEAVVYHSGGGVTNRRSSKILILQRRNQLFLMVKNYSFKTLLLILPLYLINVLAFSLIHLKNREFQDFWTGYAALLSLVPAIPSLIKKRYKIQFDRRISDQEIIKKMSPNYLGFVGSLKWFYSIIWRIL